MSRGAGKVQALGDGGESVGGAAWKPPGHHARHRQFQHRLAFRIEAGRHTPGGAAGSPVLAKSDPIGVHGPGDLGVLGRGGGDLVGPDAHRAVGSSSACDLSAFRRRASGSAGWRAHRRRNDRPERRPPPSGGRGGDRGSITMASVAASMATLAKSPRVRHRGRAPRGGPALKRRLGVLADLGKQARLSFVAALEVGDLGLMARGEGAGTAQCATTPSIIGLGMVGSEEASQERRSAFGRQRGWERRHALDAQTLGDPGPHRFGRIGGASDRRPGHAAKKPDSEMALANRPRARGGSVGSSPICPRRSRRRW